MSAKASLFIGLTARSRAWIAANTTRLRWLVHACGCSMTTERTSCWTSVVDATISTRKASASVSTSAENRNGEYLIRLRDLMMRMMNCLFSETKKSFLTSVWFRVRIQIREGKRGKQKNSANEIDAKRIHLFVTAHVHVHNCNRKLMKAKLANTATIHSQSRQHSKFHSN